MVICYIGLGSNLANKLGTPIDHLTQAVSKLWLINTSPTAFAVSSLYISKPFGVTDQPDFYNAVARLATTLSPHQLLDQLQAIEQQAKRQRLRHWGERSLDLDLLLYAEQHIQDDRLTVPHRGILQRNFVVQPLLEITPKLSIGKTKLAQLTIAQNWDGLKKIAPFCPTHKHWQI